jgi:hypothetical protein
MSSFKTENQLWTKDINTVGGIKDVVLYESCYSNTPSANAQQGKIDGGQNANVFNAPNLYTVTSIPTELKFPGNRVTTDPRDRIQKLADAYPSPYDSAVTADKENYASIEGLVDSHFIHEGFDESSFSGDGKYYVKIVNGQITSSEKCENGVCPGDFTSLDCPAEKECPPEKECAPCVCNLSTSTKQTSSFFSVLIVLIVLGIVIFLMYVFRDKLKLEQRWNYIVNFVKGLFKPSQGYSTFDGVNTNYSYTPTQPSYTPLESYSPSQTTSQTTSQTGGFLSGGDEVMF